MNDSSFPGFCVSRTAALSDGLRGPQWVRFSLPLEKGRLPAADGLTAVSPSGESCRLQARPLATWDDGSARWVDCQAIVREAGPYAVEAGSEGRLPDNPVVAEARDGDFILGNGLVSVCLASTGPSPIGWIDINGTRVTADDMPSACCMETAGGERYTAMHEEGRRLRWMTRGPVSAGAQLSGVLASGDGRKAMSYRLRVQLVAGLPVLSVVMWVVHDTADVPAHEVASLTFSTAWRTPDSPVRHLHQNRYSALSVSRDVATGRPVEIRAAGVDDAQIRVENPECLEDATEYPHFMGLPVNETQPYTGLSLEHGWVACHVEDFIEKCPKGLVGRDNEIVLEMWPTWAGPCVWRQGKSRAMALHLAFGEDESPTLAATLRLVQAAGLATPASVDADVYARSGEFHAGSVVRKDREGVRRLDRYLTRIMQLDTPMGMWDLGDTYEPGYSRTYAAIGRLKSRNASVPARFKAGARTVLDWSNPNQFEPVWSNNEYDVIIAMAREIMRGGDSADMWRQVRWFARHAVEVDFIHYSDQAQLHHGSPAHSVCHDQASAYPSHLWSEGLLAYYCLSGDEDALDVAVKTGDYIINFFRDPERRAKMWKFSRELGWALLHVATLADITREERFKAFALELADRFLEQPLEDELLGTMVQYSFGYASIVLGVEAVTLIDDNPAYRDWIVRVGDGARRVIDGGQHGVVSMMNYNYLVPAYEITGDRAYLETGRKILEVFLDSGAWHNSQTATKDSAMKFRGLSRFIHHAHNEGLLDAFEYTFAT